MHIVGLLNCNCNSKYVWSFLRYLVIGYIYCILFVYVVVELHVAHAPGYATVSWQKEVLVGTYMLISVPKNDMTYDAWNLSDDAGPKIVCLILT